MDRKEPIFNEIINELKRDSFENSYKISLKEASDKFHFEQYFYDELNSKVVNGFPIGSEFVDSKGNNYRMDEYYNLDNKTKKDLRLKYYYLPPMHEIYIGTTGSGKTTGCVEPQIRAIVSQKNKPNIFLTDPKGEIFNRNAEFIKKNGYEIFVLNFKDIRRSHRWNPLSEICDEYLKIKDFDFKRAEKNDDGKYLFKEMSFENLAEVKKYCQREIEIIENDVSSLVKQFIYTLIPIVNQRDPSWEQGAQITAEGIIYVMLKRVIDSKCGFTKEMFSLKTFFNIYEQLCAYFGEDKVYYYDDILKCELVNNDKRIANLLSTVFANSEKTRKNYIGVFDSSVYDWRHGHILALTTGNSVDFEKCDKPFAIFVITRDYEKSDFKIAGLFIDYVYRTFLLEAERKMLSNEPVPTIHFMLDEFGNIPPIPYFDNKIATSRSRNIWMHLFVQSYEQIYNVYTSKAEADVILSNCNSRIFLGSQSYKTIETFANECGRKTINLSNMGVSNGIHLQEVNVLLKSDLDLITAGSMYMKRLYLPVIYTHYIRSYLLGETGHYKDFKKDGLIKMTPFNDIALNDPMYTYVFTLEKKETFDFNVFNGRHFWQHEEDEDEDDDDDDTCGSDEDSSDEEDVDFTEYDPEAERLFDVLKESVDSSVSYEIFEKALEEYIQYLREKEGKKGTN